MHTSKEVIKIVPKGQEREWDTVFQMLSWWDSETIQKAKVMVVGAGALGNEVLKNLTLMNIGNIFVVDFDDIEYSNLSKAVLFRESDAERKAYKVDVVAERLKEINSNVKFKTLNGDVTIDVGLGIFRRMDVVISCLDNRLARLSVNRACHAVSKTWVDGAIENLAGQLNVYQPGRSCYECGLSPSDWKNINFRLGCPDVARRNLAQGRIPTTPISSSIIGAMQVQEALKVINKNEKQSMAGKTFYYEGMSNEVIVFNNDRLKDNCQSHFTYENIIAAPLSADSTIKEALNWIEERYNDDDPAIRLNHDLILKIAGRESEVSHDVLIPKPHFVEELMEPYRGVKGEDLIVLEMTSEIDKKFLHQDETLKSIGIPYLDILQVLTGGEYQFVELTDDEDFLTFV